MTIFLRFLGCFVLLLMVSFFLSGCITSKKVVKYKEDLKKVNEKKVMVMDDLKEGKIDIKTAIFLLKDIDDLKNKLIANAEKDNTNIFIEIGSLLMAIIFGSRYRDKVPFMTRPGYKHNING